MPVKIDFYTPFDDAFRQSPELVWAVAQALLAGRSFEERHALLHDLALASANAQQDEQLLVLLQMIMKLTEESTKALFEKRTDFKYAHERDRAAERESVAAYLVYVADLFWLLPEAKMVQNPAYSEDWRGAHAEQTLVGTKSRIFRELLAEWVPVPTDPSIHAFRRAIAMGWPMNAFLKSKRDGEDDVELKARGRFVGPEERKQYLSAVRVRLENFGSYEDKMRGADAVYGPWLSQRHVPEDIEKLLVIARAKMGGIATARRDTYYASVLDGVPQSGIVHLGIEAAMMRQWRADAVSVVIAVVAAQRKRNPYWHGDTLPHSLMFTSQNDLTIEFDRCRDADDQSGMFCDANVAIASAMDAGRFKGCAVCLVVRQSDDTTVALQNRWCH